MKKFLIPLIQFFFIFNNIDAQTPDEINSLKIAIPTISESAYIDSSRTYNSELDLAVGILFRFYKKHISSQDMGSCIFYPTCSEYALVALRKQGFIIGTLNFIDRLTRCNKNTSEYYPINPQNGLSEDPFRNIFYEEK